MKKIVVTKGDRFGRLVVQREVDRRETKSGDHMIYVRCFRCLCDCGKVKDVALRDLRRGMTMSCGCFGRETSVKNGYKTGSHFKTKTPTYRSWCAMKARCLNKKHPAYKHYKNIPICKQWVNDFEKFYEDMGVRPRGMTLDRIDGTKGYSKKNCRWADYYTQANNSKSNRREKYRGKTYTVAELSRIANLEHATLLCRLNRGWSVTKAVEMPLKSSLKSK